MTLMTLEARLKTYLLARLRREEINKHYRRAEDAGLMQGQIIDPGDDGSGRLWSLTARGVSLLDEDRRHPDAKSMSRFERALRRSGERVDPLRFEDDIGIVVDNPEADPERRETAPDSSGDILASSAGASLAQVREHAPPASVADVTIALLLSQAFGASCIETDVLMDVLRRPNPCVILRAPVPGFERLCADMIERELIIPRPVTLVDAIPGQRLTRHYRDNPMDRGRVFAFSGVYARDKSENGLNDAVSKALLETSTPILVIDEAEDRDLPNRLAAAADLVVEGQGITSGIIAEVMNLCLGIHKDTALAAMTTVEFKPLCLGIEDLVAALRPGRSPEQIVGALERLDLANYVAAEESQKEKDRHQSGNEGKGGLSGSAKKAGKTEPRFDLVQPAAIPAPDKSQRTDKIQLVETLAGYGVARDWALDLKSDLALWREGYLDWSEMSTKLLLSGPPGTGKTTFARALCNTLQVPLLATSVSQWLEASYLGDVMTAMSATFDAATKHRPAILFIDEIDGIGRRGGGGAHADYWDSLVNRALELLDGVNKTEGVIVVGATNSPDKIDPALRRSGRLETHVEIQLPDTDALVAILAYHLGGDLDAVIESRRDATTEDLLAMLLADGDQNERPEAVGNQQKNEEPRL
jgi:hypothetical protein